MLEEMLWAQKLFYNPVDFATQARHRQRNHDE
jgi:hypothetical protein